MEELILPEFLLAEYPIKDGSVNDLRSFIVHKGISLIEIIPNDEIITIVFDSKTSKQYSFFDEDFTLVYHTNNVEYYNIPPLDLLDKAWQWYREYLIWEDTQDL